LAAHFAKRNTKFGGAFSLAREARRQFRSKKVRISSNKRTKKTGIAACLFCWWNAKRPLNHAQRDSLSESWFEPNPIKFLLGI
jgi:hypothetical protein